MIINQSLALRANSFTALSWIYSANNLEGKGAKEAAKEASVAGRGETVLKKLLNWQKYKGNEEEGSCNQFLPDGNMNDIKRRVGPVLKDTAPKVLR